MTFPWSFTLCLGVRLNRTHRYHQRARLLFNLFSILSRVFELSKTLFLKTRFQSPLKLPQVRNRRERNGGLPGRGTVKNHHPDDDADDDHSQRTQATAEGIKSEEKTRHREVFHFCVVPQITMGGAIFLCFGGRNSGMHMSV